MRGLSAMAEPVVSKCNPAEQPCAVLRGAELGTSLCQLLAELGTSLRQPALLANAWTAAGSSAGYTDCFRGNGAAGPGALQSPRLRLFLPEALRAERTRGARRRRPPGPGEDAGAVRRPHPAAASPLPSPAGVLCGRRQPPAAPRGEAGGGRRAPLRMAAAPGDRRGKPPRGRAARAMFPQPEGVPGPAYGAGRRRPAPPRPRHVRTIFEAPPPPPQPPHRFGPAAAGTWCDLCCRFVLSQGLRCADCKYTCHAHCRDLVHLGCRRNGKLMDCLAPHDTLDPSYNNGQVHL
ncbi:uncharacterized protein LJ206_005421 [Theristicus caerulescens]